MKTKASRLAALKAGSLASCILDQVVLTRDFYENCSDVELNESLMQIPEPLIVRSSSFDEDQANSNAGKYLSIQNVSKQTLRTHISSVFASYEESTEGDEVLIQEYLMETDLSGVIFTADPNTGSPYFVINYHSGSDTSAITSGNRNGQTVIVARNIQMDASSLSPRFSNLINLAISAENLLAEGPLDIEFACQGDRTIILQARPLSGNFAKTDINFFESTLTEIANRIESLSAPHPDLLGDSTFFSVMADWNPAELIGVRPNQLAISLFRELISDNIWAYERSNYGYRNLRSFPLVLELGGHPYVDYRVSFNSLIPAGVSDQTGKKLAALYLKKLAEQPELHDKVEFEVYFGNWNLQLTQELRGAGFSTEEIDEMQEVLLQLTSGIIRSEPYGLKQTVEKMENLKDRFLAINNSHLPLISKIFWLIEDCKRHGTLPFSGIARCAFIATDLLKSLERAGYLSVEELDNFFSGLTTITTKIQEDSMFLDKKDFLERYGHLRPGSFDINNLTYLENYENYFADMPRSGTGKKLPNTAVILEAITRSKMAVNLGCESMEVLEFCVESIQLREELKFEFSKNISAVLRLMNELGDSLGFSRLDMGNVNISAVLSLYKESASVLSVVTNEVKTGKLKKELGNCLWLPPLILRPEDVFVFELTESHPNFITQKSFSGDLVSVHDSLRDNIVLIESADPGYDWIFLHQIGALITCYGGANSHMAVRCKELGIPAAIGVGEELFRHLSKAHSAYLSCSSKIIEVIQ